MTASTPNIAAPGPAGLFTQAAGGATGGTQAPAAAFEAMMDAFFAQLATPGAVPAPATGVVAGAPADGAAPAGAMTPQGGLLVATSANEDAEATAEDAKADAAAAADAGTPVIDLSLAMAALVAPPVMAAQAPTSPTAPSAAPAPAPAAPVLPQADLVPAPTVADAARDAAADAAAADALPDPAAFAPPTGAPVPTTAPKAQAAAPPAAPQVAKPAQPTAPAPSQAAAFAEAPVADIATSTAQAAEAAAPIVTAAAEAPAPAPVKPAEAPAEKPVAKAAAGKDAERVEAYAPTATGAAGRTGGDAGSATDKPGADKGGQAAALEAAADSAAPVHAHHESEGAAPAPAATTASASAPVQHTPPIVVRGSPETVAALSAQILKKLDARSTRFDIELHPADLGKVDVRLEIGAGGQISASMSFDNPQAAAEMKARANELQKSLEQAGFDLSGGMTFDVAGDPSQQRQAGQGLMEPGGGDAGAAFRGRAFQAALDTANDADAAPMLGNLYLRRGVTAGVDVRI